MKKEAVTAILLILLLIGVLLFVFDVQPVKASETIYIRADGSLDPPTANITTVDNITYTFTDNNYDSIVVERDNIVIDGAGYTLQGTESVSGIELRYSNNVTLKNVKVTNFYNGIYLSRSSNNTLIGNTVTNNNYGIRLGYSTNSNVLAGNNVLNNEYGIELLGSSDNVIAGNAASNNTVGIYLSSSSNNTFAGNTASNNSYGIYLDYSSNNTLVSNTASNNTYGIRLYSSSNNVLVGNAALNNQYDFSVWGYGQDFINYVDTSNTVDGKPIYYLVEEANVSIDAETNAGTIYVINSNNITMRDVTLTRNRYGVFLWNTTNSKIENVTTSNNVYGIYLRGSSDNVLVSNTASNNEFGILLLYSSDNNILAGNVASKNKSGIDLRNCSDNVLVDDTALNNEHGIFLSGSSNNTLFHNSLINNTNQVTCYNSMNTWDDGYPSGGNCWSDYEERYPNATEINNSGIWNTPYVISENNQDNYPLIPEFPSFLILPLFMIATLATVVYAEKRKKQ